MCVTAVTLGYLGQVCPEAAAWRHCACLVCVRWLLPTTASQPRHRPAEDPLSPGTIWPRATTGSAGPALTTSSCGAGGIGKIGKDPSRPDPDR
jgi:hypothetical protein